MPYRIATSNPAHAEKAFRRPMADSFQHFIAGLVKKYGTAQRLAATIDISLSAFSRGVRNEGTLSVENLLKLAEETGEPPSKVLRLANKAPVADIIERLYGDSAHTPLSAADRELLQAWHALPPEAEHALRTLLRALAVAQTSHKKKSA